MTRVKALNDAGYSKQEARNIIEILDNDVSANLIKQEAIYDDIVSWALDATGNNVAFTEAYGFSVLNDLRGILGLSPK